MLDLVGHLGYLLIFLGMIRLSQHRIDGWVMRFLGETTWLILGIYLNLSSIIMWGAVFLVVDIIGFRKWKNEQASVKKS